MPEPRSVPVTVPSVRAAKRRDGHPPLVMVTAYDAPGPASPTPPGST